MFQVEAEQQQAKDVKLDAFHRLLKAAERDFHQIRVDWQHCTGKGLLNTSRSAYWAVLACQPDNGLVRISVSLQLRDHDARCSLRMLNNLQAHTRCCRIDLAEESRRIILSAVVVLASKGGDSRGIRMAIRDIQNILDDDRLHLLVESERA